LGGVTDLKTTLAEIYLSLESIEPEIKAADAQRKARRA